jgi:hypothetical protein
MAVSNKEMMDMLKADQMPEQTPPPSEQGAMTAPMSSPMTTPEPQEGNMEQARLNVMMALDMLQNALQEFGMESEEGMALQKVVGDLTSKFGERESSTRELMPAEIMNLIQTLPQAGGANARGKGHCSSASTRYSATTHAHIELHMELFKPRGNMSPRRPTDNTQQNGQIVNTPRYATFGGLKDAAKIGSKNKMTLSKPGDGKKVI